MKAISSRDNPTIKHLRKLVEDVRYRRQENATVLDGAHLLQAASDAGIAVLRAVVTQQAHGRDEIIGLLESTLPAGCELLEVPDALMRHLSPVESPSGVLTEIRIPPAETAFDLGRDALLLEGVQDAGNLGTLLRTAAAAGVRQVKLSPGCAQLWSPKVLRAGMGAHFSLGIEEGVDLAALVARWRGPVVATSLGARAQNLYALDLRPPCLWLFGSEGGGLSGGLLAAASVHARIPMAVGSESLNVAAAAAVCLFEQYRQRNPGR